MGRVAYPAKARTGYPRRVAVAAAVAAAIAGPAAAQQAAPAAEQVAQQTSGPATAAPPSASSDQLEEITVSARYRTEDVQNTPIAITAMSGDQMDQRGFTSVVDVAKIAPNVSIDTGGGYEGKSAQTFIRGVGQSDFDYAYEPGVAMYIDDVYFGTVFGSAFGLMDIDHVEVLRGPQGTLFGRNAEGGAIRLFSVKPKGDDSGYVEASYGSYNRLKFRGALDVALVPGKVFFRVSGASNTADGYVDVIDFACAHPNLAGGLKPSTTTTSGCKTGTLGGDDVQTIRGALRIVPTDGLEINLESDLLDDRSEAGAEKVLYYAGTAPNGIPKSDFITPSPFTTYYTFNDLSSGITYPNLNSIYSWGYSGSIDWDVLPDIHVKSVTSYRGYDGQVMSENGVSPYPAAFNYYNVNHHQFTQEVDITGNADIADRKLEWTAGGFYFTEGSFYGGIEDITSLPLAFTSADPSTVQNESGFLHAIYHITDDLSFEGGYRYTNEDKTYTFYHVLIEPFPLLGLPAGVPFVPLTTGLVHSARSDAKAGLQYQITPEVMAYADVATGYKAGGINPRPFTPAQVTPFGPEDLRAYEVGEKAQFFDNRLRINTAAFVSDYKGLQIAAASVDNSGTPADLTSNVGHVLIEGLEAEVEAVPVSGLMLNASAGYIYYNTLSLGSAYGQSGGPGPGAKPPLVPKWKFNLGGQYAFDLGNWGTLTPRLDYTYQSTVFFDAANTPAAAQPGYGLLDGRLSWDAADPDWEVALQVSNLTNQIYYTYKFNALTQYGAIDGSPGRPREFLLTVKRSFGGTAAAPAAYTPPPAIPAAAPAPPPAAAAPEAQREFQVFFDFDKSDITDAAAKVIQAAADVVKAGGVAHITVTGHTDTVGSAAYNQGLSERRAASVKTQLVSDGVSGGEIGTVGVGKTGLLIPTADGVREPQNRRAVIQLQ